MAVLDEREKLRFGAVPLSKALGAASNHFGEKEGRIMSDEGPAFYDNEEVFQTYLQHRHRPDNPNDTLEKPESKGVRS